MAAPVSAQFTAAVLGGSGAVGKEIVSKLLEGNRWKKVVLLNRREMQFGTDNLEKLEQHILPIDNAEELEAASKQILSDSKVDAIFVAMGVGKPSSVAADDLRKVDLTLPTAFANGASLAKVRHASLLTSGMADANATPTTIFGKTLTGAGGGFYLMVKGLLEANVKAMSFTSVSTFRPAALIGTPNTPGFVEKLSVLSDMVLPIKFKSSDIRVLANAMVVDAENKLDEDVKRVDSEVQLFTIYEAQSLHDLYDSATQLRATSSSAAKAAEGTNMSK
jgi:nucleoside-diphosphate-sugar epimerase